jgi:ferritin-like metal-binding protein YciE
MLGAQAKAVGCPAIDGIIKEANEIVGEVADKAVLDAALINAAQAAEHYEIARYGTLLRGQSSLGATTVPPSCTRRLRRRRQPTRS